jgi:hypothetical protein
MYWFRSVEKTVEVWTRRISMGSQQVWKPTLIADIGINDEEEDKEEEMEDIFQHITCWKLVTTFNFL